MCSDSIVKVPFRSKPNKTSVEDSTLQIQIVESNPTHEKQTDKKPLIGHKLIKILYGKQKKS